MNYLTRLVVMAIVLACLTGREAAAGPIAADARALPEFKMVYSSGGGTLLLSDSPELVTEDGILYQDKVQGEVRLFFYHVNATDSARQMAVLLENNGPAAAHVSVRKHGLGGPDYVLSAVGKEAITDYLASSDAYRIIIPPRGAAVLAEEISETALLPNMLLNGIFDFSTDRPVTVKVIMMPLYANVREFARHAKVLPADEVHLRGTFSGANRTGTPLKAYDPIVHGAVGITLADNKTDVFLKGIDATDGTRVVNFGNYGVVYRLMLPSKSKVKFSCYLTPRGGEYAGAVGIFYRQTEHGPVATPADSISFGGHGPGDFALLGVFDGSHPLTLTFSPPGGSNLPVRIVVVPEFYY